MKEPKKDQVPGQEGQDKDVQPCDCSSDPFASLPPALLPKQKSWKSGLRHVTCPGCGLVYWTNRESDYCSKCTAKGLGRQGGTIEAE